jgi:hypothetical protein
MGGKIAKDAYSPQRADLGHAGVEGDAFVLLGPAQNPKWIFSLARHLDDRLSC